MTRRELIRWCFNDMARSDLVLTAKADAPAAWADRSLYEVAHDPFFPLRDTEWQRCCAEIAMEFAAIRGGFLDTVSAELRDERVFFASAFERDAWVAQQDGRVG